MSRRCPRADDVSRCPLYLAAHVGGGCDDGRLEEGGCAVDRGLMDYAAEVDRIIRRNWRKTGTDALTVPRWGRS